MVFPLQTITLHVHTAFAFPLSPQLSFIAAFHSHVIPSFHHCRQEILYVFFQVLFQQARRLQRGQRCLEWTWLASPVTDLKNPT